VASALLDDLNTPEAISRLYELDKAGDVSSLSGSLRSLGFVGNLADPRSRNVDVARIHEYVAARAAARAARNWQESDRIRDELAAMGVILRDNKDGTTSWELKR
jgi:cysteinyl-tRNA synthetase